MPTPARVVVQPAGDVPLEVREVQLPDPGPTQVIVRQFASGICHSQLHQMHRPRQAPVLLGHESTGIVTAAGAAVAHVREGDTVLLTWVPRSAADADAAPTAAALDLADGRAASQNVFTWADCTIADGQYVVKASPDVPRKVGSIIGCAVMTGAGAVLNTANVQRGESVAVFGVGGVGLSAVVAARMRGAEPIIAVDLDDAKLAFSKGFGATHGVNAARGDPIEQIHAIAGRPGQTNFQGRPVTGVDYAFDCIGLKATMEQLVPACRPGAFGVCQGGMAVLVGIPHEPVELNALAMVVQEKQFRGSIGGSCSPDRDFPTFLAWQANGDLDLDAMVTARYAIDDINEATTALAEGRIAGRAILDFDA